jgi:hypothetical protein
MWTGVVGTLTATWSAWGCATAPGCCGSLLMASALVTPAITKQPIAKAAASLEDMRILHQWNCFGSNYSESNYLKPLALDFKRMSPMIY